MSTNTPAQWRDRSPPFSRIYAAGSNPGDITAISTALTDFNPNLTSGAQLVILYNNPASGMTIYPTAAAAVAVTWKDAAGIVNTFAPAASGIGVPLDIKSAVSNISLITNAVVIVRWHSDAHPTPVSKVP